MTLHIKRAVAAMAAVLTLLTLVPTAALPTIQLPALSEPSAQTTVPSDDAANDIPEVSVDEPSAPANEAEDAPAATPDAPANTPSTPANEAEDAPAATPDAPANTPSAPANDAADAPATAPDVTEDEPTSAIELEVMTGPVKPEDVLTSDEGAVLDENNTLYIDSDNDGEIEAVPGDVIEDDEDFDTEDLFEEMVNNVTIGKEPENTVNTEADNVTAQEYLATNKTASGVDLVTGYQNNAYEPTQTDNEDHPFLPGGAAWIDLSKIKYGAPASPTYPFTKWSANTSFLNTSVTGYNDQRQANEWLFPDVDLIDEDLWSGSNFEKTADTNKVSGTTGYVYNRYDSMQGKWGVTLDKNTQMVEWTVDKTVDIAKTPNLMFSTEQQSTMDGVAGNKLAIAVQIGTPTAWSNGVPTAYAYRWYTISDNNLHPGLDYNATVDYIMEPEVQISKKGATTPIINDMAYIDGELTGCIDMVYWLPFVNDYPIFHVKTVRLYSQGNYAARVNYLYFNNQAAPILSPMSINASVTVETTDSTEVLANASTTISSVRNTGDWEISSSNDDQNGWMNGAAFTDYYMTLGHNYSGTIDTTSNNNGRVTWNYEGSSTDTDDAYIQVIIPVRKWMNVVIDSRRMQMSVSIDDDNTTSEKQPVFMLRGNNYGYARTARGTQYDHSPDSMLGVFGGRWYDNGVEYASPYLLDRNGNAFYTGGDVDYDFTWNMSTNGDSNWYDLLDSHYIREHMVQSGDMYGWVYVTEMLICVPLNMKCDIGQVSFKNNSDSLNAAGVSNAFDGGTGVQPMVDVSSGQTVSNQAAAFGPLLPTSNYTTFDLLPRVKNSAAQKSGDQTVYGKIYKTTAATPYAYNPVAVTYDAYIKGKIASGVYFPIFATTTQEFNGYTAGLTCVNGEAVYVRMDTVEAASTYGDVYEYSGTVDWTTVGNFTVQNAMMDAVANDAWTLSSFGGMIKDADDSTISYPAGTNADNLSTIATNSGTNGGMYMTRLDYSWQQGTNSNGEVTGETGTWGPNGASVLSQGQTSNGTTVRAAGVRWIRGTDTIFSGYSRFSVTRTFSDPLVIAAQTAAGYTGNAPVLRYHFTTDGTTDNGGEPLEMVLIFEINGSNSAYYVVPNDTTNTITLSRTRTKLTTDNTYSGYLSLEHVIGNYTEGATIKLVSLSVASRGGSSLEFNSMEVLYESSSDAWDDGLNIVTPADGGSRTVADSVDVISDAFKNTIARGVSTADTLESRFFQHGDKGWAIASYDLDTATSGNQYTASGGVQITSSVSMNKPEYRPTLDHLRIPVEANKSGKFVFEANRAFPTSMFRYLYVSYSVSDDDNIAAADDAGTGISMAVFGSTVSETGSGNGYYVNVDSNGDPTAFTYAASTPTGDLGKYSSCVNLAVDMTKVTGLATINKIAFFLKNTTDVTTDFYINYLFLSNVPPTADYQTLAERPFYQNYYLMDGSGDRYSCRFPTTHNPTGRVSSDDLRVNPLIIERGDVFHEGTFYNGTPLSAVYNSNGTTVNSSITGTDALEAVWFYNYDESKLGEEWNINDFYQLTDETISFKSTYENANVEYDALWNYNRWLHGWGLQQYIGYDKSSGSITGSLMELYATGNQVLLRTGLEPIKYQTTYDTQGGQMTYPGSADINDATNGLIENENNYYITETVVLSYYTWPTAMNAPNTVVTPVKYGYTFNGWYTAKTDGTRIYRYNTKQEPGANYLYAQWTKNTDYAGTVHTLTFTKIDNETEWFTRTADYDGDFEVIIPWVTQIDDANGSKTTLAGWKIEGDTSGKVYTPGMKLTVTKDITLVPFTDTSSDTLVTITVSDAKLYLYNGTNNPTEITNGHMGIKVSGNTYSNIPRYTVLVAKPTTASSSKSWQISESSGSAYLAVGTNYGTTFITEVSTDYEQYKFAANENMTLSYATALTDQRSQWNYGATVWTSPKVYKKGRQMMFYTQFELPENAKFVSCGTLYTKDTQVGNLGGWSTTDTAAQAKAFYNDMIFDEGYVGPTGGNGTSIRYTPATTTNDTNQYYWMVTENKGNAVTYYARGYVEFTIGTLTYIAYSSVVSSATIPALN